MSFTPNKKSVIALGFFDGVHRGHAELIKMAKQRAKELNAEAAVLSFDVSPEAVIKGHSVPLITSVETRTALFRRLFDIENVIICHFDEKMMTLPWRAFIDSLVREHGAVHLVVGHDFRCGFKGEGDAARIAEYCASLGLGCDIIPKFTLDGVTVSSTYIRGLISCGDIERANYFLGHPYVFTGTVVDGRKVGRKLGAPTVNLEGDDTSLVLPANGVYAGAARFDGKEIPTVTNVGFRPTFGESDKRTVEAYLLDFEGDLYGKTLQLDFYSFLRPERRFDSPAALGSQISADIEQTRLLFESVPVK